MNFRITLYIITLAIVAVVLSVLVARQTSVDTFVARAQVVDVVKSHNDETNHPRHDIAFGSDDAAYRTPTAEVVTTSFGVFTTTNIDTTPTVTPAALPGTSGQCSPATGADADPTAPTC